MVGDRKGGDAAAAAEVRLAAGTRVAGYVVEDLLASGGFGEVYRAERTDGGLPVALKVIRQTAAADPALVERFRREVEAVNRVAHPSLARLDDFGHLPDGRPFFAMELLEGRDLSREVGARGPLPPDEVLELIGQVCAALEAAHACGVVHRDLKPENVFITFTRRVKVVDFGIAKLLGPSATSTTKSGSVVFGTPLSIAPEQIRGEAIDARTDVYGVGVLLYFSLTGRYPFHGSADELLEQHLRAPPPPHPRLRLALAEVVGRCLAKQPADRYPTAGAVATALRLAVLDPDVTMAHELGVALLAQVVYLVDADEDTLTEAAETLEEAHNAIAQAGFQIVAHTEIEVLGARRLPFEPTEALAQRADATELAEELQAAARQKGSKRVRASFAVRAGEVEVRNGRLEIVSGQLLDLGAWPRPHDAVAVTQRRPRPPG
jgi:serine/threonine-protein kinase